jgi:hypothetical protein
MEIPYLYIRDKVKGVFDLLEILIIIFLIILIITFFLIIGIKNKQQAIRTYTIPFFVKGYSDLIGKGHSEEKSFIEKLKDFFDDSDNSDFNDDGNPDLSDDGDE